jgi:hypothetical protein
MTAPEYSPVHNCSFVRSIEQMTVTARGREEKGLWKATIESLETCIKPAFSGGEKTWPLFRKYYIQ